MKIISWNIRGCNHPRKWKNLARKIKQERLDIIFLQETKCSSEGMGKFRENIWKGSRVMALDAASMVGGVVVLWRPNVVDVKEWWAN